MRIDTSQLTRLMQHGEKRMVYAVVNAINNTAKKVQEAERAHVKERFTVRKEFTLREAAVISPFASVRQGIPYAEIGVGNPNKPKPRFILAGYEEGGARPKFKGTKSVAVPIVGTPARPSFAQSVPAAYRFTALRLRITPRTPGAKAKRRPKDSQGEPVRYGLQGTYQVPGVGVYQRQGGGDSRLIYAFDTDPQLPDMLDFQRVARTEADAWFPEFLEREVADVLTRAVLRG